MYALNPFSAYFIMYYPYENIYCPVKLRLNNELHENDLLRNFVIARNLFPVTSITNFDESLKEYTTLRTFIVFHLIDNNAFEDLRLKMKRICIYMYVYVRLYASLKII